MTKIYQFILIFLILSASTAFAGPAENANAVVDRWVTAFSANDADAIVKLYAPDAILLGTISPSIGTTQEQIKAYFARLPNSGNKVAITERNTTVLGDDAVVVSGFYEFLPILQGKPTPLPSRFTIVLAKREDAWFIVHHHSSLRPKPPQR